MEKKIKIKKIIWTILLIIGILTFVITLAIGAYHSIFGIHDGICILCDRPLVYGLEAFMVVMIFAGWLFWPAYVIGIVVIILAIIRLAILKKKMPNTQGQ